MLNFFEINAEQRFVDLPGYGYARVPLDIKQKWHKLMETYFSHRKSLCGIVLVMDVRHPLTEFDQQMISWCSHTNLPIHILLTKADKLTHGAGKNTLLQVQKALKDIEIPLTIQLFSALKKIGIDEAHTALDQLFGDVDEAISS